MASRIIAVIAAALALLTVYAIYVGGNPMLATAVAAAFSLGFFVYTARRTYAFRYLFPGLAGIALFMVLPMAYTLWIGFTNYSSQNLLTFERATEVLLSEQHTLDTVRYQFSLHADGDKFRIVLETGEPDDAGADASAGDASSIMDEPAAPEAPAAPGSAAPGSAPPAAPTPAGPVPPSVFVTLQPLALIGTVEQRVPMVALAASGVTPGDPLPLKDVIAHRDAIRAIIAQLPDGSTATMASLREFTPRQALYVKNPDGSLTNQVTHERLTPDMQTGYYTSPTGIQVLPGFRTYIAADNYLRVFTDAKFRGPFLRVFVWTVVFAGLTVLFCTSLGLFLAELLSWEGLRFSGLYRVLLFLPYAVPGFISILVFKGLFNRNFGEINLILDALLGIRPDWMENPYLARAMLLIVNTWLGYPYFMLIGMGLQKSIPKDLYEASALAGAGPITNFFKITWPLIRKPLAPLMIAAFAYNFNNFVLVFLLTAGRPDFLDTSVPAGETDILVSYTYRIAFDDSGQNFGLAAAISTLIFVMVAIISVINMRATKANAEEAR